MIGKNAIDRAYADAIKPIRNHMRQYSRSALLNQLLWYLNHPPKDTVYDLQRLPWVAERLLIWFLADNPIHYGKRNLDSNGLIKIINLTWNHFDKFSAEQSRNNHLSLWFRQHLLPQAPYQTGLNAYHFLIQLFLVKQLDPYSKLRRFLDLKAHMPIETYLELAFAFWIHSNSETPWLNGHYFKLIIPAFRDKDIDYFLCSICLNEARFYSKLSKRMIEFDEWFQPLPLYETPCIFHENTIIPINRQTLRRYFDNLIGDWVEEDTESKQDYDNLIENYVRQRLVSSGIAFFDERTLAKKLSLKQKEKVCDFLVNENDGITLIEVKNKALTKKVPSGSRPEPLKSRLKATILKGIAQLDQTINYCKRDSDLSHKPYHRFIITKTELYLGSSSLLEAGSETLNNATWLISLQDFDQLIELIKQGRTTFSSFFKELEITSNQKLTPVLSVGKLLEKEEYRLDNLPDHLNLIWVDQMNALEQKLKSNRK